MVSHKKRLNIFKKTEVIQSIFPNQNEMKLDSNNRRKTRKFKYVQIKQHILKQLIKGGNHKGNLIYLEINGNNIVPYQTL